MTNCTSSASTAVRAAVKSPLPGTPQTWLGPGVCPNASWMAAVSGEPAGGPNRPGASLGEATCTGVFAVPAGDTPTIAILPVPRIMGAFRSATAFNRTYLTAMGYFSFGPAGPLDAMKPAAKALAIVVQLPAAEHVGHWSLLLATLFSRRRSLLFVRLCFGLGPDVVRHGSLLVPLWGDE